jgi:hypothetical protein
MAQRFYGRTGLEAQGKGPNMGKWSFDPAHNAYLPESVTPFYLILWQNL